MAVLTPSVEIKLDVAALAVLPLRLSCALLAVPRPPLGQVDPQRGLAGEDDGAEAGEAAYCNWHEAVAVDEMARGVLGAHRGP